MLDCKELKFIAHLTFLKKELIINKVFAITILTIMWNIKQSYLIIKILYILANRDERQIFLISLATNVNHRSNLNINKI